MELGLATFADLRPGQGPEQRLRELMEEAVLADEVGVDVFGIGEHHRADYAVSSPAVALAVAAGLTRRIRLTSAVTVLSSDDPVRVFQDFATLDLLSGGRVDRFAGLVERYREAAAAAGHDPGGLRIAVNGHAFVGETAATADAAFAAHWLAMMNALGRERGWPPLGREQYEAYRGPRGALLVGAPEQVAEKILYAHDLFGSTRYVAQMSVGAVAHADIMRSIELYGARVVPLVREELARRAAGPSARAA
jgi:alkanesulfonate monooxygenase SsuD/methylene tetrahydromethanopterin reductase-like flavin-dependent oxidoreductase (luciferase family)